MLADEQAMREAIRIVVPNFDGAYRFSGGNITFWESPSGRPQPSQAELDAARPRAYAVLAISAIRVERDRRIAATDYQAMPDYPPARKPAGLDAYRKALRDFPATVDAAALPWPLDVSALNWPQP